jgi:hypothetical protein
LRVLGWGAALAAAVLLAVLIGSSRHERSTSPSPAVTVASVERAGPATGIDENTRDGYRVAARLIGRAEETFAATFTETLPQIVQESLALALQRPSGGQG